MTPQMELSFENSVDGLTAPVRRYRRLRRARWWFEQMRQAVDHALDRHPTQARPEQIYFTLDRASQLN